MGQHGSWSTADHARTIMAPHGHAAHHAPSSQHTSQPTIEVSPLQSGARSYARSRRSSLSCLCTSANQTCDDVIVSCMGPYVQRAPHAVHDYSTSAKHTSRVAYLCCSATLANTKLDHARNHALLSRWCTWLVSICGCHAPACFAAAAGFLADKPPARCEWPCASGV